MADYDMEAKLPREKVFRDPIHDYIYIQHQIIIDLIDTHEFQRLRRIKQLGMSSYTFHGAEHSRFSHSLGVYEVARRICDTFERNFPKEKDGENGWDDSERFITLCAALLHDVGHGPFSHAFESIFKTNHEAMTQKIILSPETEINQVLSQVAPDFPEKVASVIAQTYPNEQVVQIISSQIDADRMDYLQRDAYFTGVTYGAFDLTRILRVIRPSRNGIAFQSQGKHAVEDYVVSRYQMHMQVYFHRVSRGMEVTLDRLLKRARRLYDKDKSSIFVGSLKPFFEEEYTVFDYLMLDDGVITSILAQWIHHEDSILSNLARSFLDRKPLKSVRYDPERDGELITKLTGLLEQAGYDPAYYTALNSSYDQPYDVYQPGDVEPGKTQIELMYEDNVLVELSEVSELVHSISGKSHGDERFYVPREFLDEKERGNVNLFDPLIEEFQSHVKNGALYHP